MKYRIFLIILILIGINLINADEQVQITCGGNQEVQIACLGDEELSFFGLTPAVVGGSSYDRIINRTIIIPPITTYITIGKIYNYVFIVYIIIIAIFLFFIFKKKKKKKKEKEK